MLARLLVTLLLFSIACWGQVIHSNTLSWSWTQGTGDAAQGYHVWKSATSGTGYAIVGTLVGTATKTYEDTAVTAGQTNYYVVSAYNTAGDSTYSNEVACVTPFQKPAAPSTLSSVSK